MPTFIPSDEDAERVFNDYALALGRVAHAWNMLIEEAGTLFRILMEISPERAATVWYSFNSDRSQIDLLKSAVIAADTRILSGSDTAREDLSWLVERVRNLANSRNDAVHAPCALWTNERGSLMSTAFFHQHQRARNLEGKDLLVEFEWIVEWSERLELFSIEMGSALVSPHTTWPDRPEKPDRKPKSIYQDHHSPTYLK